MRARVVAVMPTVGRSALFRQVVRSIMNDVHTVLIPDNWPDGEARPWDAPSGLVTQLHRYCRWPGIGLYEVWNRSFVLAQAIVPGCRVLFINDDVTVPPALVETLWWAMDRFPEFGIVSVDRGEELTDCFNHSWKNAPTRVKGTYRMGGISGHCFMVDPRAWPKDGIDERFRIWFGDDDLVWKVREAGWQAGVLRGLVCGHPGQSGTVNAWPNRDEIISNDRKLWDETGRP